MGYFQHGSPRRSQTQTNLLRELEALSVPFVVQVAVLVQLFDRPGGHREKVSDVLVVLLRDDGGFTTTHRMSDLFEIASLIVMPPEA